MRPKFDTSLAAGAVADADADGLFDIAGLPSGKYYLSVVDRSSLSGYIPDQNPVLIDVTGDRELDLTSRSWADSAEFDAAK